jgi:glycosyltransferase involved in cell wall biosynthesis
MQTNSTDFDLTIIVPVFNEEGNLDRLHGELLKFMNDSPRKTKVLFVNDGSKDGSLGKLRLICKDSESFLYCSFDRNYGLSAALKAGFDHSDTPLTGYIDADLQTSPEDFRILLEYINDYDLVQGVRQERKDSFVKNASSVIANNIRRMFTHDGMDDTGCPLKIIRTDFAKRIPMFSGLHRFIPAMVQLQKGRVLEVPVRHFPRIAGKSNYNLWKRLLGPLSDCFAYLWMKKKYINYKIEESSLKS